MTTYPNLLEAIRARPGMYLGEVSVTALYHTISGYRFAVVLHRIEDDRLRLPDNFNDWVAYRLRFGESTSGWKNMILERVGDEAKGFHRFFELLDEYEAREPRVVATLNPRELRDANVTVLNQVVTVRYPKTISLVAYTDDPGFFVIEDEPDPSFSVRGFYSSLRSFELRTKFDRSEMTVLDAETFARWISEADQSEAFSA